MTGHLELKRVISNGHLQFFIGKLPAVVERLPFTSAMAQHNEFWLAEMCA